MGVTVKALFWRSQHPSVWMRLMLVCLSLVVFFPMLDNGFAVLAGDDGWMVYNNPNVYGFSWNTIANHFTSFYHGQYSPINTLAYAVIYHFFGLDPFWYHLFCLLLHITNGLLVFAFIRYLLKLSDKEVSRQSKYLNIAFITALLFSIHPMQVESVAWIAASKIVFYSLLFLLALLCYLKYTDCGQKRFYWGAFILFILSFGIKEQTVVFPLCLIAIDYYLKRTLLSSKVIMEKVPFIIMAVGLGIIEIIAQNSVFGDKLANEYYPLSQRLVLASFNLTEYGFKLAVPINLSYWYRFPMAPGEALPLKYYFYPIMILIVLYYLLHFIRSGKRQVIFGSSFFIINILLALHIIPMSRGVIMADRYIYLSCIGFFFIAAGLILNAFDKPISRNRKFLYRIIISAYLLLISQYTFRYADQWT